MSSAGNESGLRHDLLETDGTFRHGFVRALLILMLVAFGIWHILTNIYLFEPGNWQNAIHFGGFAFLALITIAPFSRVSNNRAFLIADVVYGLLVFAAALWIAGAENGLYERTFAKTGQSWQFRPIDWAAGLLVIFAALDATRRLAGWIIPALAILSLSYLIFLGEYAPGVFRSASLPVSDVLFRTLYNDEGMFGSIATISSANIVLFMIFGGFLVASGASEFVTEISRSAASRLKGGQAFVAVISSALVGTISGSAVANTASTGVITIPLMKSAGFRPQFAAGVEAAASTGGQIMPPIMGAGAFVMASYTGIPYGSIVAVSVVPALLYFLSVAFIVRIEACKNDIPVAEPRPLDRQLLAAGALNFIVPLGVMIYMLMAGYTPSYAAVFAIGVLIAVSWLTPYRMTPRRITVALVTGIKSAVMTAVLLCTIGIINNAITTSGVGSTFSLMIAQWSQGSLLLAIVLIAITSLILGMGLPVTAAYIVLAILSAPALAAILADGVVIEALSQGITDPSVMAMVALADPTLAPDLATGLPWDRAVDLVASLPPEVSAVLRPMLVDQDRLTVFLLTAHLIIFWLSQDSNVTPPVCLAAFTAAGIAGAKPMASGFEAWRLAKGLYIIPLLFVYTPLISGSTVEILQTGFFAVFGIYGISVLLQQHSEGPLSWWMYPAMIAGVLGALWQDAPWINVAGVLIIAGVTFFVRQIGPALGTGTRGGMSTVQKKPSSDKTLRKGFRLLETLAGNGPMSLTELAALNGLTKGNTHHLLQTLVDSGYVFQEMETSRYGATLKIWEVAVRVFDRIDLVSPATQEMKQLAAETRETVNLAVLSGTEVIYLHKIDSVEPVRSYTRIGGRAPAHCSATGKAMLAFSRHLPNPGCELTRFSTTTITDLEALKSELAATRERGYSQNIGEWRGAVNAVGAPVFGFDGHVVAGISVAGPGTRLTTQRMREIAPAVMETARRISQRLGARKPELELTHDRNSDG